MKILTQPDITVNSITRVEISDVRRYLSLVLVDWTAKMEIILGKN